ncbi:MAG: hypothetical protein IPM51_02675 [Sphingobacteriaceae bacterium]|nr:hypothetical protein [Sphingobacteriaceae bacterium]
MIQLLKKSKFFYLFFVLAIFLRILSASFNPILTSDYSIQLEAAKNYHNSGKFNLNWVNAENLSQIQSQPMNGWPVGSSFIYVLLNWFTGNLIYSQILFQCIGVLLFLIASVKLLRYFSVSDYHINLFLLLFAFNPSPFYYLGPTDLFTASLFLWIIYHSFWEVRAAQFRLKALLLISILSFITATVRLACIPNLIILPLFFFVVYLYSKRKEHLWQSVTILSISVILTFIFYKIYPFNSERTGFLSNLIHGNLFFNHLKWFDPFPIKALLFTRPIEFHLPHLSALILTYRISLLLISFGFLALILNNFIPNLKFKAWIKNFKKNMANKNYLLTLLFLVSFAVITGFIAMQSLTTGPENNSFGPSWMPPLWTFVYATRYFVYLHFIIIVLYFIGYSENQNVGNKSLKLYKLTYSIFLVWAILYWGFINYQFLSKKGNGGGSEWVNEKVAIATFREIQTIKSENLSAQIVSIHHKNKKAEGLVTNYSAATPCDDYEKIMRNEFKNSSPVTLIITMPKNLSPNEKKFLNTHAFKVLKVFDQELIVKVDLT